MNGRPDITQLNQAVAEFSARSAGTADAAAHAYHAKVASNLQAIVQREAALGPAADEAELARLQTLLGDPLAHLPGLQRRLCAAIASGAIDLATPGLAEHLWRTALDQAAIDQPSYSTCLRHRQPPQSTSLDPEPLKD